MKMNTIFHKRFVTAASAFTLLFILVLLYWYSAHENSNRERKNSNFRQRERWHTKHTSDHKNTESDKLTENDVKVASRTGKTILTRLGSSLAFDTTSCPKDSMLLTSKLRNSKPQHNDCPTLFIVGARKGGTTSLYNYISKHPDFEGIFLNKRPGIGETFYFASSRYLKWSWEEYVELFPSREVMSGDASVGNLVQCQVPERIFTACGKQAKVVMLLRDPVVRFVSNVLFRHAKLSETTNKELEQIYSKKRFQSLMTDMDEALVAKNWSSLLCLFSQSANIVYEGLYYVHLLNWLCNFPPENILIVNSEEFFSEPSDILDQVIQFLRLKTLDWSEYDMITNQVYNKGKYEHKSEAESLTSDDKEKLLNVYGPFNEALLRLLDWPLKVVNWEH